MDASIDSARHPGFGASPGAAATRVLEGAAQVIAAGCWESGGPEFLFPLMINTGVGGVMAGIAWVGLWTAAGRKVEAPASGRLAAAVFTAFSAANLVMHGLDDPPLLLMQVSTALPILASMIATGVALRRRAVDGTWPPARALPTLVRWSLPVATVLSVLTALVALVAQIVLGGRC